MYYRTAFGEESIPNSYPWDSNNPDIFDAKMSVLTVRLALPEHNIDNLPTLSSTKSRLCDTA